MTSKKSRTAPQSEASPSSEASLRDRAGDALESAREKAIDAYGQARESAGNAGRKAGEKVGDAPMLALAGGLAAGAVLAALLPKSRVEQRVLGPVGERLSNAGRDAIGAAKEAGASKLGELNITRDAGAEIVKKVMSGLGDAARASGQAAVGTIRNDRD